MGSQLFNIFLCNLYLFIINLSWLIKYADGNTPLAMGSSELEVINEIKSTAESFSLWFQNSCMKMSLNKFHLLLGDRKIRQVNFVLRSSQVCAGKNFRYKNWSWAYFSIRRRELVQKKATQKVNSLAQISCSRIFEQRKRIIDSFINSLFLYSAPIFMFLSGCLKTSSTLFMKGLQEFRIKITIPYLHNFLEKVDP